MIDVCRLVASVLVGMSLLAGPGLGTSASAAELNASVEDALWDVASQHVAADTSDGAASRDAGEESGQEADPNAVPYETDRSLGYHLLALPSYVMHGVTRPLGWGVKYLENNYPALFTPQAPTRGVRPIVEFGGPVGVSGGLVFFDHRPFGTGHDLRLEAIYGARNFYEFEVEYDVPGVFGERTALDVETNFFTNPEDRFFLGGNDSRRDPDEARYFVRQADATVTVSYPLGGPFSASSGVHFERTQAKPSDGEFGRRFPSDVPGLETNTFLGLQSRAVFDVTSGPRLQGVLRRTRGTRVIAEGRYSQDLDGSTFRHVRLAGEVQQFIPLGFLPETRRLAVRARVEAVEPVLGGDAVPFYRLPEIGGQQSLRGFIGNRFVDDNTLVVNVEYRYPMWGFWDAVLFVDAGQVFESFDQVAVDRFQYSYGAGFQLLTKGGLLGRFEVAGSVEGVRTVLTVSPLFRR